MTELSPLPIKPVGAAVYGVGKYKIATTVSDLASILLSHWPIQSKRAAWRHAMVVCLDAIESHTNAARARAAFVAAAEDADISLIDKNAIGYMDFSTDMPRAERGGVRLRPPAADRA